MTRLAMGFILQKPGLLVNPRYPNCPAPGAHSKAIGMVGSENPPYVLSNCIQSGDNFSRQLVAALLVVQVFDEAQGTEVKGNIIDVLGD